LDVAHLVDWIPLVVAVYDAIRAYSPDTFRSTHCRWRVRIAFALAEATCAADADVVHVHAHLPPRARLLGRSSATSSRSAIHRRLQAEIQELKVGRKNQLEAANSAPASACIGSGLSQLAQDGSVCRIVQRCQQQQQQQQPLVRNAMTPPAS
jgi:hypothetical protein